MEYAVELNNLTKTYQTNKGTVLALDNVNLTIPKGSIFALLGPNGAGKSTLINILAGLALKSSGSAKIMKHDITASPNLAKASIGVVPQELIMDTFFQIYEALEIYAGYYGIRPQNRKTEHILKALGLWDKRNAKAKQLSGGMKRRFLVAKAMVHSPPVLILDEPTAGVDIELREQLWEYVKYLNQQGTTIILTTHYLKEAEELCDYIAFINKGKIIAYDTKNALLNNLGFKEITLALEQELFILPNNLTKYDTTLIDNNTIKIKFNCKEHPVAQIMSDIHQTGLVLKDINTSEANLEDIFRHIMSESNSTSQIN